MEASFDDWLQPFEDSSMANHDNWLITDQEEEGAAAMRKSGGGMMSAAALVHAFGGGDIKLEDRYDEDEEIATGNQGDLERFFKHGSTGLDTLLTKVEVKEELSDVDAFSFRWDDDEELKLNGGSDTEDHTPSLHLDPEDQLLLSSGILSFDDITLHSTSTSLSSTSPSLSLSAFASVSLSSSMPSPMLSADNKGSSPSSPAPSSSPLPSSPSSILPVAPAPSFQLQQQPQMQQQYAVNYAQCSSMPQYAGSHAGNTPSGRAASAVCAPPPPVAPTPAVQSAPTTTPRAPRPRRDSISGTKASAAAKKAGVSSTPPRPRRRRAASTTVARDKQERMEKELAGDDKAKAILSGPLTLEKLASLSTLKVSVLQKQLKMLNASTKGSKAQLIQRLVRYMYLFSQQHRHQLHSQCPSTSGVQHTAAANAGSRCNGLFVDPTLINADSLRAKTAMERGRSSSIGDGTPVLSSSAPSLSIASYLSTHVFPTPLQITLTGRIVEEEEEEEFSD